MNHESFLYIMKPTRHTPRDHSNPPYPVSKIGSSSNKDYPLSSAVAFIPDAAAPEGAMRTYNIRNTMLSHPRPYLPRMSLSSVLKLFVGDRELGNMKFETPSTLIMFYKIGEVLSADYLDKTSGLRICISGSRIDIQHSTPGCYVMSNANVGGRLIYDKLVINANNTRQCTTVENYSDAIVSMDPRMVWTADLRFELDMCAVYNTTENLRLSVQGASYLIEYRDVNVTVGGTPIAIAKYGRRALI